MVLSLLESVYSPFSAITAAVVYTFTVKRWLVLLLPAVYLLLGMWHPWAGTCLIIAVTLILVPFALYQQWIKKYTYRVFVMIPLHRGLNRRVERFTGIAVEGQLYELHWNKRFKTDGVSMRELVRLIRNDCKTIGYDLAHRHTVATVVSSLCTTSIADVGLRAVTNMFDLQTKIHDLAPRGSKMLRPNAEWETRVWHFDSKRIAELAQRP